MTDQITQLDEDLKVLDQIADELERQVAPCPVTRLLLLAWLTEWVRGRESQAGLAQDLSLIHISEPTRPRFGSRMPCCG